MPCIFEHNTTKLILNKITIASSVQMAFITCHRVGACECYAHSRTPQHLIKYFMKFRYLVNVLSRIFRNGLPHVTDLFLHILREFFGCLKCTYHSCSTVVLKLVLKR